MGYFLPQKYKELHNLCFYLHDILVQVVKEGEKKKLFHTLYNIKKISDVQAIKDNNDILEWLSNNGYEDEFNQLLLSKC